MPTRVERYLDNVQTWNPKDQTPPGPELKNTLQKGIYPSIKHLVYKNKKGLCLSVGAQTGMGRGIK